MSAREPDPHGLVVKATIGLLAVVALIVWVVL